MKTSLHDCKDELKGLSLKVTPARLAILKILEITDRPLDLFSITNGLQKRKIDADPTTVFRIINIFTDKGLTKKIQFLDKKSRYELSNKKDHHHLICLSCEEIQDIEDKTMNNWERN